VVIAGAGVAGLEALLALRALAGDRLELHLIAPTSTFVYRPLLVAEPFGIATAAHVDLAPIVAESGAHHRRDGVAGVEPEQHIVHTTAGAEVPYDALLLAVGARPVSTVPGALTFGTDPQRAQFAQVLSELGRRGKKRLAFIVPPQTTWTIAAYELALLTAAERDLRRLKDVELFLVTHEATPLEVFGTAAAQLVCARLQQASVELRSSSTVQSFEDGSLRITGGEPLSVDAAVALPALEVADLPGLPQRSDGFLITDVQMHVFGLDDVWAAGDLTTFPIKQGGLAAQQADVAARAIAARAGAHAPIESFQPVLRGALITGGAPEFLRSKLGLDDEGEVSVGRPLWSPPEKLAGKYLGPFLARTLSDEQDDDELVDLDPPRDLQADADAHAQGIRLILAAADADAREHDYAGALRWLALAEELNFVLPADYVTRRFEWRRELDPSTPVDSATGRIDPSFVSAAAALSDLRRRVGWLREIQADGESRVRADLAHFDKGLEHLIALSRRTGNYPRRQTRA
jgi:sulfide:quinone oxidoreductase